MTIESFPAIPDHANCVLIRWHNRWCIGPIAVRTSVTRYVKCRKMARKGGGCIRTIAQPLTGSFMSIGDFDHFGYSLVHVLSFATISKFKDERMFQSSWSPEDQQAVERIARKLDIDLEANDLAGSDATFTSIEGAASKIGRAVTAGWHWQVNPCATGFASALLCRATGQGTRDSGYVARHARSHSI